MGGLAIVRYMDHVLVKKVFCHLALVQTGRAVDVETPAYVLATNIDTTLRNLACPIGSKQFRRIIPLPLVAVEAVRVLQVFDGIRVFEVRELPVERRGL